MRHKQAQTFIYIVFLPLLLSGCALYHEQEVVLIPGIDVDQTLEVADHEIQQNKWSSVLTLWAVRDQMISKEQAEEVSRLYFGYIKRIDSDKQEGRSFSVWHLTWAISNMYRLGDESVQEALSDAYEDAAKRVEALDRRVAHTHFSGDKIYMGFAHGGGKAYARNHLVVPGNEKYLQSVETHIKENPPD